MTSTIVRIIKREEDLKRAEVGERVIFADKYEGVYAGNTNRLLKSGERNLPLLLEKRIGDQIFGYNLSSGEYNLYHDWKISKNENPIKFNMYNAILEAGK